MQQPELITVEGLFLHGIYLEDWYPCWNLSLCGHLTAPEFAALCDPGLRAVQKTVDDLSVEEIRDQGLSTGIVTPRGARYGIESAIIRGGGNVGIGVENTQWLSQNERRQRLSIGDIELEFEKGRRRVAPAEVSRLSCLWVADNSPVGRTHIENMLPGSFALTVSIPAAINVSRVDTAWFDKYCEEHKEEYIENYWEGIQASEEPTWEYLVNGVIKAVDENELRIVRERGAKVPDIKGD